MGPKERTGLIEIIRRWSRPLEPLPPEGRLRRELELLKDRTGLSLKKGPFRVVLFDIYGTLFVSGSGDIGTLEGRGTEDRDRGEVLAPLADPGDLPALQERFAAAVRRGHAKAGKDNQWPEIRVEEIWAELEELRRPEEARELALRFELAVNPVYPMPGLQESLRHLKEAGLPLGIVSNAQFFTPLLFPAFLGQDLETLGFDPRLSVYSYQEGEAKPSVRLFQKLSAELGARGIKAREALFVGNDMLNDIWAAKAAGFAAALFGGDGRSLRLRRDDPRCRDLVPDFIIQELTELAPAVGIRQK